ncbi:MAG: metallophosphoesterase [Candidatus Aminicenantes bacterium]|nr:metallophosphoesterase [Candidatus Aminicenantes bacterium]
MSRQGRKPTKTLIKKPRRYGISRKHSLGVWIPAFIGFVLFIGSLCCLATYSTTVSPALPNPILSSPPPPAAKNQCVWTGVERIVAVGDLHGDYDHFKRILRGTGIVDRADRWSGGKTHLVQMGDVMDRGDYARDIFDLIRRLEKEAKAAGGMVHQLIGNHEELNIARMSLNYYGEYVTYKQFIDFLPVKFRVDEEEKFKKKNRGDGDIEAFWNNLMKDPNSDAFKVPSQRYYENFNMLAGKWIAEQNVAIKINDTVFVHGGLNLEYASKGLEAINNLYRSEFQEVFKQEVSKDEYLPRQSIIFAPESPLWNRDPATDPNYVDEVDKILAVLNAKRLVVAHTPTIPRSIATIEIDINKFGGKVWIIDTGIATIYHGFLTALIIDKNGRVSVGVY